MCTVAWRSRPTGSALALKEAIDPRLRQKFADTYGELPDLWRGVVLDDMQIADALQQGDSKRAQQLIEKHLNDPLSDDAALAASDPSAFLSSHITNGLAEVRLVVWKGKGTGKLRPGVYCEKARQVVYALLVARLGRPGSYSACKRCGKVFEKRRAWQPYCSYKCRVAEAMKRYRANKKKRERGKSQGRKSGRRPKQ